MQIQIKETIEQVKTIEVEFPYYSKSNIESEHYNYIIYNKIEEKNIVIITEYNRENNKSYTVEIDNFTSIIDGNYSDDFKEEYKSTEQEFNQAKQRAIDFLNQV